MTGTSTMDSTRIARLYLIRQQDGVVWLQIPGTNYQIELKATGPVKPSPQGRVRGVIRCPVFKLDVVSAGGAYIEPIQGRSRRVQGAVIGTDASSNSVVVDVAGQPIVGDLPPRWQAGDLIVGTRVGLDIKEGATFEPM